MSLIFEDLINKNNDLISLDTNLVYESIFEYLKDNLNVDYLKIYIKKSDHSFIVFNNANSDKEQFFYTHKVKVANDFEITFGLVFLNQDNLVDTKEQENTPFILKSFSNTIYIKHLEGKAKESLILDNLTGCYNRAYMNYYIKPIFSLAQREGNKIAFLKVGIDHFKAVLDEFNYDIGDKVIISLANVLKNGVRESDLVIRMSNDSFLVILQNICEDENAIFVANKLIDIYKNEKVVVNEETGQTLMKTICIGITIYPKDGSDLDTIIKKADIAIREAKNRGRSKSFLFSEEETNQVELF